MIIKMFSVYDLKANAFMQPFFFFTAGTAERAIVDQLRDENSSIGRHPEDFSLYELGEFDDTTGKFTLLEVPHLLVQVAQLVRKD